jgi:hypothetical protein
VLQRLTHAFMLVFIYSAKIGSNTQTHLGLKRLWRLRVGLVYLFVIKSDCGWNIYPQSYYRRAGNPPSELWEENARNCV